MNPTERDAVSENVSDFFIDVSRELTHQEMMLSRVRNEGENRTLRSIVSLGLLILVSAVIIMRPETLHIWLIVALLLYSYNFVILLLPTTTGRTRPKQKVAPREKGTDHRWLAIKLLLRKKKLAIEMGLTVFLGGMVPLTLSFTIILGTGLCLLAYFLLTSYSMVDSLVLLVSMQVSLIITFYALIIILHPQSQGITLFARAWKDRIGIARSKGWAATTLVLMVAIGLVTALAILFIGALILPGVTLASLLASLSHLILEDLFIIVMFLAVQIWVMRSFQSLTSRRMAITILSSKVGKLKELLTRCEVLNTPAGMGAEREERFQAIMSEYYAFMIYDVIRLDFFSYAPVYLVGPRLKYVLDEKVIAQLPG
ncbi:MAG TPA: hypothetical protein VMW85_07060 [Methanomassiliicoccales archaeon]|nr:hypothetical protein [Methanomassiliicoccales archaeon]